MNMNMNFPAHVKIVEVGPRDGLQNESPPLPVETRIEFIRQLAQTGLRVIEVGSFTSEKVVPQMANTDRVLRAAIKIKTPHAIAYPVLTPNLRGLEDALAAGATEVAVFTAASETFSRRNTNCGIDESIARIAAVTARAQTAGVAVRGYISCALGCPYQGEVSPREVARIAKILHTLGCYEISLGDTIGVGTPAAARAMLECVMKNIPREKIAAHFHDTYGQALANVYAALQLGVRVIDSAAGGLGGCPFARGASGNLATEDLVYMLDGLGVAHGVSLQKLRDAGDFICAQVGRQSYSKVARALAAKTTPAE